MNIHRLLHRYKLLKSLDMEAAKTIAVQIADELLKEEE